MDIRSTLRAGAACLLLLAAGCMADDVVYVDQAGNELAVDAEGRPILPEQAPVAPEGMLVERAPAAARAAPSETAAPVRAPVARAVDAAPAPDPRWDMPVPAKPVIIPTDVPPARKVGASSDLDRPPAG